MTHELTDEEKIISDKLDSYIGSSIIIHLTLKREVTPGKKVWLNGIIRSKATNRVWIIQERELGEMRVAVSEILNVEEYKENK